MTTPDLYDVLELLLRGQISGLRLLDFSIKDNFDSDAELQDGEISDLPTPPPKPPTASPGNAGISSANAELDHDVSGLPFPAKRTIIEFEPHAALPRDMAITEPDNDVNSL